jgi:hypothetical protein
MQILVTVLPLEKESISVVSKSEQSYFANEKTVGTAGLFQETVPLSRYYLKTFLAMTIYFTSWY